MLGNAALDLQESNIAGLRTYATYGFKAILSQIEADDITLQVWCADGAGRSMFGCEPEDFVKLDPAAKADLLEGKMCMPMSAGIIIKYDPKDDDTFICLYDVSKIEY